MLLQRVLSSEPHKIYKFSYFFFLNTRQNDVSGLGGDLCGFCYAGLLRSILVNVPSTGNAVMLLILGLVGGFDN